MAGHREPTKQKTQAAHMTPGCSQSAECRTGGAWESRRRSYNPLRAKRAAWSRAVLEAMPPLSHLLFQILCLELEKQQLQLAEDEPQKLPPQPRYYDLGASPSYHPLVRTPEP